LKRFVTLGMFVILALCAGGCGNSPTDSRTYTDSLTLGTGRHGIDLTGETTIFPASVTTIYWRVESAEPFLNANVLFILERKNGVDWEEVYRIQDNMTGLDDHVAISSYFKDTVNLGPGSYRATAKIGSEGRVIGPTLFTVQ
jgi:hypothetical protein